MTNKERDTKVRRLFVECLDILMAKGHDYSGNDDCLRNFRRFGSKGVLVRMNDKLERLISLSERPVQLVLDETIDDTVRDLINYAALYSVVRGDEISIPTASEDYARGDVPCEDPKKSTR